VDKGISGLVLISEELEKVLTSLYENKVPESWKFCYLSLKPLYSWVDDLIKRVE
jgi:dynein heavy chain